ncbi:DinB family protein [Mucilaginibacter sp. Bleaf8]|uniref:DinB family protein n=1 Tax=Mucilaginibacter sp. Bleaf8 TaxID=2834430 RepID=UPI001BCD278F|nr:DinB family protein [Mucilaginibacter sp. Bleaf8]MBS7565212.1 DinB family protein [Mucilaginibacter sp. Bleaf8]
MNDYFIRLFDYDRFANLQILETIVAANHPEKPLQLLSHMLGAQQIWLKRCKQVQAPGGPVWPNWSAEEIRATIEENYEACITFVNEQTDESWQQIISYTNTSGQSFHNKLVDIITHVINHGTHHRAQAGIYMKQIGIEKLPATDYILYIREHSL